MLCFFFFVTTARNTLSTAGAVHLLVYLFLICSLFPSISNASLPFNVKPHHTPTWTSSHLRMHLNNINQPTHNLKPADATLERSARATGFFVYRKGAYLLFVPDRRHHFTKNMRPYIGRRR